MSGRLQTSAQLVRKGTNDSPQHITIYYTALITLYNSMNVYRVIPGEMSGFHFLN